MIERKLLLEEICEDIKAEIKKDTKELVKKVESATVWQMRISRAIAVTLFYLVAKYAGEDGLTALQTIFDLLTMGLIG